ncbi:hypothetical protein AB1N83_014428 [Pleurotus pulmonarius]
MSASSSTNTFQRPAPAAFEFEEAEAVSKDLVTFAPILVRDPSPTAPHLSPATSSQFPAIPSLLGRIIERLFNHTNHAVVTPVTGLLTAGDEAILLLDDIPTPNIKNALGKGCTIQRTTLAFITEFRIFQAACLIVSLDIETILEPFKGDLLISPMNGQLSMESLVFDPRYYGFGAVVGFFTQTSNGHFVKTIMLK